MNMNGQAARTAADMLARIEHWTRMAFFVGVICALFLAAIAGMIGSLAIDYANAKRAVAEASRKMSEDTKARLPMNKGWLR